jgi:3-carboxy-cis,cis-muconate cycloisomerase
MNGLRAYLQAPAMAQLWSDEAVVAAMLRFEAGLAHALADCGVIPATHAQCIADICATIDIDAHWLGSEGRSASTLAIPVVKALTQAVAKNNADAAKHVHYGATSQDMVDTAMMLQADAAVHWLLLRTQNLGDVLSTLAQSHASTPMTGRTLLQAAVPIPFGYKAAAWLNGIARAHTALARVAREDVMLQLGGASGTLHVLGSKALAVRQALAARLHLNLPAITWHAQRGNVANMLAQLALLCGATGKIGTDVALLMQNEISELSEPVTAGRGTSSAMPHKRNPVGSMLMIEAALRAPAYASMAMSGLTAEHERAVGAWQGQLFVVADAFNCAASAVEAANEVMAGLVVDAQRMQANLAANAQGRFEASASFTGAQQMIEAARAEWQQIKTT